jgi:hypothetical protein
MFLKKRRSRACVGDGDACGLGDGLVGVWANAPELQAMRMKSATRCHLLVRQAKARVEFMI